MNNDEIQLLSVTLTEDIYGIDITKVQEIRALGKHRNLPNMPNHCVGVIDFRNTMVPVVDLREMFGYEHEEASANTVIVVMLVSFGKEELMVGIVVDSVSDVIVIDSKKIKDSPTIGGKVDTSFIKGMFKHEDHIVVMLTLESILESETLTDLKALVQTEKAMV